MNMPDNRFPGQGDMSRSRSNPLLIAVLLLIALFMLAGACRLLDRDRNWPQAATPGHGTPADATH